MTFTVASGPINFGASEGNDDFFGGAGDQNQNPSFADVSSQQDFGAAPFADVSSQQDFGAAPFPQSTPMPTFPVTEYGTAPWEPGSGYSSHGQVYAAVEVNDQAPFATPSYEASAGEQTPESWLQSSVEYVQTEATNYYQTGATVDYSQRQPDFNAAVAVEQQQPWQQQGSSAAVVEQWNADDTPARRELQFSGVQQEQQQEQPAEFAAALEEPQPPPPLQQQESVLSSSFRESKHPETPFAQLQQPFVEHHAYGQGQAPAAAGAQPWMPGQGAPDLVNQHSQPSLQGWHIPNPAGPFTRAGGNDQDESGFFDDLVTEEFSQEELDNTVLSPVSAPAAAAAAGNNEPLFSQRTNPFGAAPASTTYASDSKGSWALKPAHNEFVSGSSIDNAPAAAGVLVSSSSPPAAATTVLPPPPGAPPSFQQVATSPPRSPPQQQGGYVPSSPSATAPPPSLPPPPQVHTASATYSYAAAPSGPFASHPEPAHSALSAASGPPRAEYSFQTQPQYLPPPPSQSANLPLASIATTGINKPLSDSGSLRSGASTPSRRGIINLDAGRKKLEEYKKKRQEMLAKKQSGSFSSNRSNSGADTRALHSATADALGAVAAGASEQANSRLQAELSAAVDRAVKAEEAAAEMSRDLDKVLRQLETVDKERTVLAREKAGIVGEIVALQSALEVAQSRAEAVASAPAADEELRTQVKRLEAARDELHSMLESDRKEHERQMNALQAEKEELRAAAAAVEAQTLGQQSAAEQRLQEQVNALEAARNDLMAALAKERADHAEQMAALQCEKDAAVAAAAAGGEESAARAAQHVEEVQQWIASTQADSQAVREDNDRLRAELEAALAATAAAQSAVAPAEASSFTSEALLAAENQVETLRSKLETERATRAELEASLSSARDDVSSLRELLTEGESERQQLMEQAAQLHAKVQELEAQIGSLQETVQQYQQQLDQYQSQQAQQQYHGYDQQGYPQEYATAESAVPIGEYGQQDTAEQTHQQQQQGYTEFTVKEEYEQNAMFNVQHQGASDVVAAGGAAVGHEIGGDYNYYNAAAGGGAFGQESVQLQEQEARAAAAEAALGAAESRAAAAEAAAAAVRAELETLQAKVADLNGEIDRLKAEAEAVERYQIDSPPSSRRASTLDPESLKHRLAKAETALEKERRIVQGLQRQLRENEAAAAEGRAATAAAFELRLRCDAAEREAAAAKAAKEAVEQQLQAMGEGTDAQSQALARLQMAEERATEAEAIAADLRVQCDAAARTISKLVDENQDLTDRLNSQGNAMMELREAAAAGGAHHHFTAPPPESPFTPFSHKPAPGSHLEESINGAHHSGHPYHHQPAPAWNNIPGALPVPHSAGSAVTSPKVASPAMDRRNSSIDTDGGRRRGGFWSWIAGADLVEESYE